MQRREEIVQGWKNIKVRAMCQYDAHLVVAKTPECTENLADAKRSTEQYIESFDIALDIIKREKEAHTNKHTTSKNTQSSYADTNCNSASPGGKDPWDKDKNERYSGPKYTNMNQVFESGPFGKRLEQNLERIEGAK